MSTHHNLMHTIKNYYNENFSLLTAKLNWNKNTYVHVIHQLTLTFTMNSGTYTTY